MFLHWYSVSPRIGRPCLPPAIRTPCSIPTYLTPVIRNLNNRLPMIRTTYPSSTDHHRIPIIGAGSDVPRKTSSSSQAFRYRCAKQFYGRRQLLPFGILWLLFRTLSYRETSTSFFTGWNCTIQIVITFLFTLIVSLWTVCPVIRTIEPYRTDR